MHIPFRDAAEAFDEPVIAGILTRLAERRAFRQPRGMLPSEKMRGPVGWTSLHQRDAMTLLELQHGVVSYRAWPMAIEMRIGFEVVEYRPLLGMELRGGRKVALDLFPEATCTMDERSTLERLIAPAMARQGYGLVWTGQNSIRLDRCLANAREVVRAAGWPVGDGARFECVRRLSALGGSASLAELADGDAELRGTACVLAMRRVLAIDLQANCPAECVVRLPTERQP